MQFLAMLTMLIDHIGIVWFPDDSKWRMLGRLALPFYAYALVIGYFRTRSVNRYLQRTGLIALLSQIPYMMLFKQAEVNTVGTLFISLLLLMLLDRWKGKLPAQIAVIASAILLVELLPFSYGAYCLLLVILYRYSSPYWMIAWHFALNAIFVFYKGWYIQLFSLASTMLLVYLPEFVQAADRIKIPRIVWRSFYPLHLLLLTAAYYLLTSG
ncbi:TraX family protein [Paenibacillus sp. MCAF20]